MDNDTMWAIRRADEKAKRSYEVVQSMISAMPSFNGELWSVRERGGRTTDRLAAVGLPPVPRSTYIAEDEAREFFKAKGCDIDLLMSEKKEWPEPFNGSLLLPYRRVEGGPYVSSKLGSMSREDAVAMWE